MPGDEPIRIKSGEGPGSSWQWRAGHERLSAGTAAADAQCTHLRRTNFADLPVRPRTVRRVSSGRSVQTPADLRHGGEPPQHRLPLDGMGAGDHRLVVSLIPGKGRCLDYVFVERLWRSVKYEEVYLFGYDSLLIGQMRLAAYFRFYNHRRPHSSLGGLKPAQAYAA